MPRRTYLKYYDNFTALLYASGLKKDIIIPEVKKLEREQLRFDQNTNTLKKNYEEEILPYHGKYQGKEKASRTIMVCSDLHSFWLDRFAFHVFTDTARRIKPQTICLAGDILDFYAISKYDKDPRRILSLESELRFVHKEIFEKLREASPDSQIDLILGNHEIRLWKFLVNSAPALSNLDALKLPNLLKLDEYQINLIARPSIMLNKLKEQENFIIYNDCFIVTHGTVTNSNHAAGELKKFNKSGCSGHVHHYQVQTQIILGENGKPKNLQWTSLGSMASDGVADYSWDFARQNRGFLIVHINNKIPIQEYIPVENSFACSAGIYYKKK